jgi:polar amino acid transport system permease protein
MSTTTNIIKFTKPRSYYIWVGVFILVIFLIAGSFYYATQKVEYIWRWNRVPIYFIYQDEIEIISDLDGEIESVRKDGGEAVISVKGLNKVESYVVPADSVKVDVGGYIYDGETLAEYREWKPGLLIVGLWLTLQISVIATIGGILIGIIGGLTRISSNPALKGLTIIYVELIRGSPLMVQILIWYFVLGTVSSGTAQPLWPALPVPT